ncbi:hypothetical protein KAR48_06100 [bacterium]|nr:hypothetical protein [bacterium]
MSHNTSIFKFTLTSIILIILIIILLSFCSTPTPFSTLYPIPIISANLSTIPDSIQTRAQDDAAILTLRIMNKDYYGSQILQIDPDVKTSIFNALMHLYLAREIPERDSVTSIYNIHAWPFPSTKKLLISFKPDVPWADAWSKGNTQSDYAPMDSIVQKYNMRTTHYYLWAPHNASILLSEQPWNMDILAREFKKIDGVESAEPVKGKVTGNDIKTRTALNNWTFYFLRNDLDPAGNTRTRIWAFRIYNDGTVHTLGGKTP